MKNVNFIVPHAPIVRQCRTAEDAAISNEDINQIFDSQHTQNDYDIAVDFYEFYDVFNAHNSHGIGFMGS